MNEWINKRELLEQIDIDSELPNEFFEACYWMQSRGIPMRVAAELAGIPTSTFRRNYQYWEGYIYDSDGRIIGEKCSKTNKRK